MRIAVAMDSSDPIDIPLAREEEDDKKTEPSPPSPSSWSAWLWPFSSIYGGGSSPEKTVVTEAIQEEPDPPPPPGPPPPLPLQIHKRTLHIKPRPATTDPREDDADDANSLSGGASAKRTWELPENCTLGPQTNGPARNAAATSLRALKLALVATPVCLRVTKTDLERGRLRHVVPADRPSVFPPRSPVLRELLEKFSSPPLPE